MVVFNKSEGYWNEVFMVGNEGRSSRDDEIGMDGCFAAPCVS
jgi:hypothetical protein